jgi:O-antigen/teichoic acid export membrane protein
MNQKSVSAKLLQNTLFNGCGKLASYLAVVILSPIILSRLGAERFALWAIVTLFAGQFGLLDLGFSTVLAKYVAEYKATNQLELANALFTAALSCYGLISGALLAVLLYFRIPMFRFFSVPESFWSEWHYLIPGMVLIFFLTSILSVLQSIICGMQEMAITNVAAVLQGGCMVALTIALLRASYGLRGVVLATVLSLLIAVVFLLFFVIRLVPSLRLVSFIGEARFIPALRFGATVQLSKISSVAVAYGDRILISHFLGLILLAKYQLGYTVISAMRGAALLLVSAVVPATSDLAARSDRNSLQNLYWRGTKYTVLTSLAIGSGIMALAPVITRAWLGHDDNVVSIIIRFLAAGQLVHVMTGLGTSMCEGMGLVALEAKFCVCLTVLQTAIGIAAVRHFGLFGLLTSTALVTAGTSVGFLYQFHRSMQPEGRFSWPSLLFTPVTAAALASCLVLGVSTLFPVPLQSRSSYATSLLFLAVLFVAAYALYVLRSSYLDALDKQLASRLPGGAFWMALLSRGHP